MSDEREEVNYLLGLPSDLHEFLRVKAFHERTTIKNLIVGPLIEKYGDSVRGDLQHERGKVD